MVLSAPDYNTLVQELNDNSFARCDTVEEFMREHALRAYEVNDDMLRTDTPEHYIEDCLKYGIYTLVEQDAATDKA